MKDFRYEIYVEWADVDLVGVVYFPHFFRYFSMTETAFYRSLGLTMLDLEESLAIRLPRVDAQCRFRKPARFGDRLTIRMNISRLGRKTITYAFEVLRGEDLIADGHLIIASVSITDFKSIPLPDKLLSMLEPYAPPQGAPSKPQEVNNG